ncbi:uncharacterized protein LOC100167416 [Acyrthosiphon pisum]|uniref:ACYPI008213 protein n=1 Tax=Acyrthosiphon pisum TaxID=7029 RepID=C4WY67_ACYPI|nr:uncharacterized protein LOC100167416 [Acyrthosiphon pisum]BAH72837.1 ACYPI008213 [Acyrthosiphon pisum]|eukprot:NP_001280476.1 uncharacterized protein LOC100167416 [Acyrthosiphon pisum]
MMLRNDTTLATAQEAPKRKVIYGRPGKASRNDKSHMIVSVFFLMLCFWLLAADSNASVIKNKRAIASATESTTGPLKECHQNTPCGWAIYVPFTRRIDYFMKNTCICNPNLACLKTDDDLSVNAYVYRCKPRPLTTTEIIPTTI